MARRRSSSSRYMEDVNAMFSLANGDLERIAMEFIAAAGDMLVDMTPGPGLQFPQTLYIATGRLRAGWQFGLMAPATVSRDDGGPYEDRGNATKARLRAQIFTNGAQRISFLWNEVAYAYYVAYGLGNHEHIGPRPWVYDVSKMGDELLEIAMQQAGAAANG